MCNMPLLANTLVLMWDLNVCLYPVTMLQELTLQLGLGDMP